MCCPCSALSCLVLLLSPLLLGQQPAAAAALPPTEVRLHGRIVAADGKPVVGAAVRFERVRAVVTADVLEQPQVVSDAEGRYELKVQPPRRLPDGVAAGLATDMPALLLVAAKGFASVAIEVDWQSQHASFQLPAFLLAGDAREAAFDYAAATEVPELTLTPGHRLVGRVRDAAGKPLAGVRVIARDQLSDGNLFGGDRGAAWFCAASSDAAGIVSLPCALPCGSSLTFALDGYYKQILAPVSAATPIEVVMQKGGWIQGRVLDKEGHSIADARVTIGYERQSGLAPLPVPTGADGSFRTNLDQPGRWRAVVVREFEGSHAQGHTALFTGPRENLEVLIDAPTQAVVHQLPVRVVAKGSGKAVAAFRAGIVWHEYANQNSGYRDVLLGAALQSAKPASQGAGSVRAPGENEVSAGWLRILAAGFAPASQQVEWKEPAAGQASEAVTVELEPEAVVRGVLRDEASGKPVGGVQVTGRLHQDPSQGFYGNEHAGVLAVATSGADGAFELRGMGAGPWDLRALDPKRPRCPLVELELTAGEQRSGLVMTLPSGAVVAGSLRGLAVGPAARAFLAHLPPQTFDGGAGHYGYQGGGDPVQHMVAIGKDGTFRCEGVGLDNWLLVLRVPSAPRLGGDLFLPIEPFRVRPGGVQREFDCSLDWPGTIHGKVAFAATDLPFDQLVVVARAVTDEGQGFFSPFDQQLTGPRSFVTPTGEFDLHVGPGSYRLAVVDLGTMLLVHDEPKKVDVKTGGAATIDMQLELVRIELELKGPADGKPMADVERIEVRVISKAMKALGMQVDMSDEYDRGIGIRWPTGQTVHSVILPLGDATFMCRNTVSAIRVDENRWSNAPLGRAELELARGNGAKSRCVIEVGPVPEVIEVVPKKAGAADVDEVQVIK